MGTNTKLREFEATRVTHIIEVSILVKESIQCLLSIGIGGSCSKMWAEAGNFLSVSQPQAWRRNAPILARPSAAADETRADSSSQCMACETAIVACRGHKMEW